MTTAKYYGKIMIPTPIRPGIADCWNAFMVVGADFSESRYDIPLCPTTAAELPKSIISQREALALYYDAAERGDKNLHYPTYVSFYVDDKYFDKKTNKTAVNIWQDNSLALEILRHFDGAITPDYSPNQDFPKSIKIYNTYRSRAFGYWLGLNGIAVFNNIRWETPETYEYCFDWLPHHDILCIGTVGGSPKRLIDRPRFESGLDELVKRLHPHTILTYGSAKYPCFEHLREQGVNVIEYPSHTARYFAKRGGQS